MGLTLKNSKIIKVGLRKERGELLYLAPNKDPKLPLQMSHHRLKVFSFPLIKYGEGPEACQALGIESLFSVRMCFQSMEKMVGLRWAM